jgi:hypothetical protein
MPAPFRGILYSPNVLGYYHRSPSAAQKTCLNKLFEDMRSGTVSIYPHPTMPKFYLPVTGYCDHQIIVAEEARNNLLIYDLHPYTLPPGTP